MWVIFHTYSYVVAKRDKKEYQVLGNYKDEDEKFVTWKLMVPVTRGFIQGMI